MLLLVVVVVVVVVPHNSLRCSSSLGEAELVLPALAMVEGRD